MAVASLLYTHYLANRLQNREQTNLQIGAEALSMTAQPYFNPHLEAFSRLENLLLANQNLPKSSRDSLLQAVRWAQEMPPTEPLAFMRRVWENSSSTVPSILSDEKSESISQYRNIDLDAQKFAGDALQNELRSRIQTLDALYKPIPVNINLEGFGPLVQYIHYGESFEVQQLRWFPYVQLLFFGLFVLLAYIGFTYVRRSEQSYLWVGMAKEAAHQLGTPTSSLMGWVELMKHGPLTPEVEHELVSELEKDIARLERVANRFSKIGSHPQLKPIQLAPVVHQVADYMRRRIPQLGKKAAQIRVSVPDNLEVPLAPELFEWVLENLIKNALDALDKQQSWIEIRANLVEGEVVLEVEDNGKGIDKSAQRSVFKPGFSTKKRGWGLGLSLAKRIVEESHDGQIVLANSKPGEGTTFRITLPMVLPAKHTASHVVP